jgi:Integrase zinc binding domain
MAHSTLTGHLRTQKTREKIRREYFWPSMRKHIFQYVTECVPCQQRRGARFHDHVPITPIVRPTLPFVMAHADCIGPLDPKLSGGHEYCLTIGDS